MAFDATDIALSALKIAIVLGLMLNVTPIMVWVERRGSALIQDRPGPNRVGPFGLLQSFADALKFIMKEDIIPSGAHKWLYTLAPAFGLLPAMTTIAVVPWGRGFEIPEFTERAKDPAVVANLRKAKFLIVHAWDANHPLTEVADVLIPAAIHAEKDGTYTNLQGRVQRIHQAMAPKGQAETDLEALRRVGARLFPADEGFRTADALDVFAELRGTVTTLAEVSA